MICVLINIPPQPIKVKQIAFWLLLYDIPALPLCVSTVRLKVTVPMSCRLGTVMLTQSSTCPPSSPTVYVRLSNPTTTAARKQQSLDQMWVSPTLVIWMTEFLRYVYIIRHTFNAHVATVMNCYPFILRAVDIMHWDMKDNQARFLHANWSCLHIHKKHHLFKLPNTVKSLGYFNPTLVTAVAFLLWVWHVNLKECL